MTSQVLDSMDLEREKGITIKARAVRLEYTARDGLVYGLNLIDTPGHVDFAYEVSHSLQACEGAILVVDAAQGIEAQTLANVHLALRESLTIIPVLNKIDLPSAEPDIVMDELENVLAIPREEVILASAKDGTGVADDPRGDRRPDPAAQGRPGQAVAGPDLRQPLRRVQGRRRLRPPRRGDAPPARRDPPDGGAAPRPIRSSWASSGRSSCRCKQLVAGEVGYVATGLKSVRDAQVGDTVTTVARPADRPLPGYQEAKSLVFAGHLPDQRRGLSAAARRAREAPPQRRELHLRAGELGRARLRLPLRLPRPAPHGDRPGAARARVLARPDRVGAVGRIPRRSGPWAAAPVVVDNPALLPNAVEIEAIEEPWVKLSVDHPDRLHRPADGAVDEPARRRS